MKGKQTLNALLIIACLQPLSIARADQAYLDKFLNYMRWTQNLPTQPDASFLNFVAEPSPLTCSLREKWLSLLAKQNNWTTYDQYYRQFQASHAIESVELQCDAQYAAYQQGQHASAIKQSQALWLDGHPRPKGCDRLFEFMLNQQAFSNQLIEQRIALALEARQFKLARGLFKYLHPPRNQVLKQLDEILHNPKHITTLNPGPLQGAFYLLGLKQLVSRQMDLAIRLSQTPTAKSIMSHAEKQRFIAHIALYKAMRGETDAQLWLSHVEAAYVTPTLTEWRIRDAIRHQRWQTLITLIAGTPLVETPAWQYWLARAYEAQGQHQQAHALYDALGAKRHYYGFLANIRMHRALKFEFEASETKQDKLSLYKPITDHIRALYTSGQPWIASGLLNAFSSELPKAEQSALAYWVKQGLKWQGKAVILSNQESLNNELGLRFPLAYREVVHQAAQQYHLDDAFIYAIIRQESLFFENNISAAGAKGLMQLMPRTAKLVTRLAHIRYTDPKELFQADKNIIIGTAYLQQLAHQFKAHPLLMTAAYNAGPRQVRYWQQHHDPQEMDSWIETLPWQETRNYLKNVMAFYAVYQYRLNKQPNLDAFLERW